MDGLPLDNVTEEKDLGVTVAESFKSSKQCNIADAKARTLIMINYLCIHKLLVYDTLVRFCATLNFQLKFMIVQRGETSCKDHFSLDAKV